MKLNIEVLMEVRLKNRSVRLSLPATNGGCETVELKEDSSYVMKYRGELNYSALPNAIKLCWLDGFVGGGLDQKIIIKGITINDRSVDPGSFFDLLDFSVEGYGVIENCHEICCNGELLLSVQRNLDRFFWCPFYYSNRKDDFVFNNSLLDDYGTDVRTYQNDPRTSIKKYQNQPHHDYKIDRVYDVACFGCSMTYGTGLSVRDAWPGLLSTNSLNLAVPGLGMDGIFLNLKNALQKFQFEKIVILLPDFDRRLVRLKLSAVDAFCRIPVNVANLDWHHSRIKHWAWQMMGIQHDRSQLEEWKRTYIKRCRDMVLDADCHRYSKQIFDRLIRLLDNSGKKFYLSSWDEEMYAHLQDRVEGDRILPYFCGIDVALDQIHAGPKSHRQWVAQIGPIVSSQHHNTI